MNSCQSFQEQFLDHLYGLLEPADAQALTAHLAQCPSCQKALSQAQGQQQLLAAAARTDCSAVQFKPPVERRFRFRAVGVQWRRWAVAACIWVVLGGLGVVGTVAYLQGHWKEQEVAQAKATYEQLAQQQRELNDSLLAKFNAAEKEWQAAQQRIDELTAQQKQRLVEAERAVKARQKYMVVTGPETIQPGAPNDFLIETKNLNNERVAALLDARVKDQNDQVVYEETAIRSTGAHRLSLPRDLPIKPNAELYLEVVTRDGGAQGQLREKLALARPVYVTHLATDKPMYQPGETVHFRSLTLDRFSLKPAAEDLRLVYTVTNPRGEEKFRLEGQARLLDETRKEVRGADKQPVRGIGAGEYLLPADLPGGEYTLTVSEASNRFPPEKRKFLVNRYQKPRLNKELTFARQSFGPGEEVIALAKVARAEGGQLLIDRPVTAVIQVDGRQYDAQGRESAEPLKRHTDPTGGVTLRFKLPARIERGDASLTVIFTDGAHSESIVKPIPIVLKKLEVEFFPEGGDLVAGVPNRVYFQVRTPLGKPADLKGRIVDAEGKAVAAVETLHDPQPGVSQGMGLFSFTPTTGKRYELHIDSPAGIEGKHLLPEVKADGVTLSVPEGVTGPQEPIRIVLHSAQKDRALLVGAYCRGRPLAHQEVAAKKGEPAVVELRPDGGVGGVYRITVFEKAAATEGRQAMVPVAERLVYRQAMGRLNLAIQPDRERYNPGDRVTLSLVATDEKGQPAPAVLLLAVVDNSVLVMADEKTARSMPTHFLLTSEVRKPEELEHADFLLSDHRLAGQALDLLLGTQGWRRFAEQDPTKFKEKQKDEAERLLLCTGLIPPQVPIPADAYEQARRKVLEEFDPRFQEQQARQAEARDAMLALRNDEQFLKQAKELDEQIAAASEAWLAAARSLADYKETARDLRSRSLLVLGGFLLLVGVVSVVLGLLRSLQRGLPYLLAGAGAMAVCALVVGVTFFDVHNPFQGAELVAQLETRMIDELPARQGEGGVGGLGPAPKENHQQEPTGTKAGPDAKAEHKKPVREQDGNNFPPDQGNGGQKRDKENQEQQKDRRGERKELGKVDAEANDHARDGRLGALLAQRDVLRNRQLRALDEQLRRYTPLQDAPDGKGRSTETVVVAGGPQPPGPPRRAAGPLRTLPPPRLVVREYAHRNSSTDPRVRSDWTETLYWHPVLVLADGRGKAEFQLSDSVTSFQVAAAAHTADGRLGNRTTLLESRKPFTLEPKLPFEVTRSDRIDVPVSIANDSDEHRRASLQLERQGLALLTGSFTEWVDLAPNQRARRVLRLQPDITAGEARLHLKGVSEPFASDEVRHTFRVVPEGFPAAGSQSDLLKGKLAIHEVELPRDWVRGTLTLQLTAYPSMLADLQKGLEGLLREPHGCFEQTSTSNYPNLLILDYLKKSPFTNPEVERRALQLLNRGYDKLISFECRNPAQADQREGYEWFGGTAPPHEALTAYGLLQFRDMARVYPVDEKMVERTRRYLMSRRDGKGGFSRNPRALDSFGQAPPHITNAYIVWALTESSPDDDVRKELAELQKQAQTSSDPYFLALVASSLLNRNETEVGLALLRKLAAAQKNEGHLPGAETSITRSGGRDLEIETTALALLAWLKANRPEFAENIRQGISWIRKQRAGAGEFGSTQSTILALKALLAHAEQSRKAVEGGELTIRIGGQEVARRAYSKGTQEAIVLEVKDAERLLKAGKNKVQIESTSKDVFPYTLSWTYQTLTPASAANCPVKLTTALSRTQATEEETVRLTATVKNVSGKGQGMTVAIIGLPAGLTLPPDMAQLKKLVAANRIGAWETRGRELILYWRDLGPDQQAEVNLDLICRVPGEYRGPASRAYLYYNADPKHWVEPLQIEIAPRGE